MRQAAPRVAFFTDSFHEVNGVARTSRQFVAFARERGLPMLAVHAGPEDRTWTEGSVTHCEFRRGVPRLRLDADLSFDLAFLWRHRRRVETIFRLFDPAIVHTTGPSDCGLLGMLLAHRARVPMVASWHTNVHEYAGHRIPAWMPRRPAVAKWAEQQSLDLLLLYYGYARRTMAPNPELVAMLQERTGRPSVLMERGIDTELFHPARRMRECDGDFRVGYVGRLSREKNVRLLVEIARRLPRPVQFCIVGQGDERGYLEKHLPGALFRGVLQGEALARAYADLDAFVFPSETDTYGNVVTEAMASGVPALVTGHGGPKYLVEDGETGLICSGAGEFAAGLTTLRANAVRHAAMRAAARRAALRRSWSSIFERVYETYSACHSEATAPAGKLLSGHRANVTGRERLGKAEG